MKNQFFLLTSLCLVLTGCGDRSYTPNADNTGRNVRDRDSHAVTSGDQLEDTVDRTITQKIRQAVVDDSSLSTYAKNVKIITINGVVTLRGPVNSDREKAEIGRKAQAVSGVRNVDNQLEIVRNDAVRTNETTRDVNHY
jgi:hyperosmotically inducible periplasmic protein